MPVFRKEGERVMKRYGMMWGIPLLVLLLGGVAAGAADDWSQGGNDSLARSAFAEGDAGVAVKLLLEKNVPVPMIVDTAIKSGVSREKLVTALLAAGIDRETVVLQVVQAGGYVGTNLRALSASGISPREIFLLLVRRNRGMEEILDAAQFMLDQGYSKAEVLEALSTVEADREVVVQIVRRLNIPPATVVSAYRPGVLESRGFGHVFCRHALPQPALVALGVARIHAADPFKNRSVISPSSP